MANPFGLIGVEVDEDKHSLFERQNGCVQCEDVAPQCPSCPDGQVCHISVPMTCDQCASASCVDGAPSSTPSPSPNSGGGSSPNIGPIVGGVIGGLAAMAILTYLIWRFCIKNRRDEYEDEMSHYEHSKEGRSQMDEETRRSHRTSTHTVHSIASTVLTRASNIIQIAYIPGVTNRANPSSPTVLVPPVPPIPLAHTANGGNNDDGRHPGSGNTTPYEDQHFFVPGDLRNSAYSGFSYNSDRTSYARTSYAPRSSVASTIYGTNAVVSPIPAQRGNFLKPSLVSVKSRGGSTHSEESVPPVPAVPSISELDQDKLNQFPPPPSPAFSIGSTYMKSANTSTATSVRPQMVRLGSSTPKTVQIKSKTSSPSLGSEHSSGSPVDQGPFADPSPLAQSPLSRQSGLSAVAEESKRRSESSSNRSIGSASRGRSPFGDENRLQDS